MTVSEKNADAIRLFIHTGGSSFCVKRKKEREKRERKRRKREKEKKEEEK